MEGIFCTVKPCLVLLKLFGLFPANFHGSRSCGTFTIPSISFCLLLINAALNLKLYEDIDSSSIIVNSSYHIALGVGLISLGYMMVYQWLKAENIIRFLKLINEFDMKVS
jgi:7tm Chemosensory receptor